MITLYELLDFENLVKSDNYFYTEILGKTDFPCEIPNIHEIDNISNFDDKFSNLINMLVYNLLREEDLSSVDDDDKPSYYSIFVAHNLLSNTQFQSIVYKIIKSFYI